MFIFLYLGSRELKSSTVSTRHFTVSQTEVENKPKALMWHSEVKNQLKVSCRNSERKRKDILFLFQRFSTLEVYYVYLNHHREPAHRHISILIVEDNVKDVNIYTQSLLRLVIMINRKWFLGDLNQVFFNRALTFMHPSGFFGGKL